MQNDVGQPIKNSIHKQILLFFSLRVTLWPRLGLRTRNYAKARCKVSPSGIKWKKLAPCSLFSCRKHKLNPALALAALGAIRSKFGNSDTFSIICKFVNGHLRCYLVSGHKRTTDEARMVVKYITFMEMILITRVMMRTRSSRPTTNGGHKTRHFYFTFHDHVCERLVPVDAVLGSRRDEGMIWSQNPWSWQFLKSQLHKSVKCFTIECNAALIISRNVLRCDIKNVKIL